MKLSIRALTLSGDLLSLVANANAGLRLAILFTVALSCVPSTTNSSPRLLATSLEFDVASDDVPSREVDDVD